MHVNEPPMQLVDPLTKRLEFYYKEANLAVL